MTEHEFEVFYSNLQLISYAVMIAVLIFVPLIIGAVLKSKKGGATRKQLIILCISSCALSVGLPLLAGYLYTFGANGVEPTSAIYTAVIGWANPLYAVPASAAAYFILKKLVMFDSETEAYKLQAARKAERELEAENRDNVERFPWYIVGKDISEGDVTVIRTAVPAFINVATSTHTYKITIIDKKESIVVRSGEMYRPFNCFFKGVTPPTPEPAETFDYSETAEQSKTEDTTAESNSEQHAEQHRTRT